MSIPWVRTCQECGMKQATLPPPINKNLSNNSPSWKRFYERKCKRCKSASLNYGYWGYSGE